MNVRLKDTCLFIVALLSLATVSCSKNPNEEYYDKIDLIPVTLSSEGRWSMINSKGEVVYDDEFKNKPTAAYNGLFSVKEDDGYTVYAVGPKNPEAINGLEKLKFVGYYEEGLIPATKPKERIGVYDRSGNKKFELGPIADVEIVQCEGGYKDERLLVLNAETKYGYYDTEGHAVIKPQYDYATTFSDGIALTGKMKEENGSDNMVYSLIDKSGKEILKLKNGFTRPRMIDNHLIATKDERTYIIDRNGEETKLPKKISQISEIRGNYMIFANEDWECGVADLKGEILVRAKYSELIFDGNDTFLAIKDDSDKEIVKINSKGDEIGDKIDYERILPAGKFGYFAKEGKTIVLLDKDFKPKTNDDYYNINISIDTGMVETDYFNVNAVANIMVALIEGNKVGPYTLGTPAAEIMKGENPKDFTYTNKTDLDKLTKEGFRYQLEGSGLFTASMADYNFNYNTYDVNYYWDPNSKLGIIAVILSAKSDWGKEGQKALGDALVAKGFKLIKEGQDKADKSELIALYKKGDIGAYIRAEKKGDTGAMFVYDSKIADVDNSILEMIEPVSNDEDSREEEATAD